MTKIKFYNTIRKLNIDKLMKDAGTVIVGYSGGADSSCLLRFMAEWCRDNGVVLAAAHVNHMIRGKEADRDEIFCRETAEKLGVRIYVKRVNVPQEAKERGVGTEEAARDVRYDFFGELSEKLTGKADGAIIATAHNSTDNLETVLMNLMRGTGLHGMTGISPVRDGRIVRPLIEDSGESIRAWCGENGVEYVTDSTNEETDCTRNAIRHSVLPEIRKIYSSPEEMATRMTSLLKTDDEYLTKTAFLIAGGKTSIGREELNTLDKAIASRVIIMLYNNAKKTDTTITKEHINEIIRLSDERNGHCSVDLPGGLCADIERDVITIGRLKGSTAEKGWIFEYTGGEQIFENELYRLTFSSESIKERKKEENIYKLSILRAFECATINGNIKIRYKTDGDGYVFGGHTHKLKKMYTDRKFTGYEKELTPVLCDEQGIIWIPGFPTRDGVGHTSGKMIYVLCDKLK